MKFDSVEVLRKAITEYSIKNRVEIKMPKNDRTRIKAHCDEECPWHLYASEDKKGKLFCDQDLCWGSHLSEEMGTENVYYKMACQEVCRQVQS